ncbi:MAG TPA: hypothetical protein EYP73_00760 [Acidimicrobiia bacterium]|nr:hypothetical protein [Acidimicrobiia bacterium]
MRRRLSALSGLGAVAVAAPLLDLYGRNPEVFVANRTSAAQIFLFGLLIAAAVPLVALAVLLVAQAGGSRASRIAYRVMTGILALALGLVVTRKLFADSNVWALLLAVAIAAGLFLAHRRVESVFVYFAVVLPAVFVLFVSASATARLI